MVASIEPLTRDDSSGSHAPREVSVWADTGSANQHSATAMVNQRWPFRMARKKTRRGKSAALSLATPTSRPWCAVCTFFRHHRRGKWQPMRVQRMAPHASAWSCAPETRWALGVLWDRSSACALKAAIARQVAASPWPGVI